MTEKNSILNGIEPREVFSAFAGLSAVPRGSGHEKAASDYLLAFAREHGLEASRDKSLNVLIRKPATANCDRAPGVILQSHVDMVCLADPGKAVDFLREGIVPAVDGANLRADGTTLGADNGIGVAYSLAVLAAADLTHPPLEAVFTTGEETGMHGALAFDASVLRGRYFINMDSEEEGVFYVSCCGGATARVSLPMTTAKVEALPDAVSRMFMTLEVAGLAGGHSGVEIDKQRGNANRLLGRILRTLDARYNVLVADIEGGLVDNAIPAAARATLFVRSEDAAAVSGWVEQLTVVFRKELHASGEKDLATRLSVRQGVPPALVFSRDAWRKALFLLGLLPDGVVAMDRNIPGKTLVETSSNFAMIRGEPGRLVFTVSVRSSLSSKMEFLIGQVAQLAGNVGAGLELSSRYPAWEFNPYSELLGVFQWAHGELYGNREARVEGIHAGLECGVFAEHFRGLGRRVDMISLGPDVHGAHTLEESLDIASTARTWDLLKLALAAACQRECPL